MGKIHIQSVKFDAPFKCSVTYLEHLKKDGTTPFVVFTREFNVKNKKKFVIEIRDFALNLLKK